MCYGIEYHINQADFVFTNLEEIFLITKVFRNKIEKHHKMKPIYARACDFIKSLACDFQPVDAEINSVLAAKIGLPLIDSPLAITEGIQEMSLGATNYPNIGIIFKLAKDSEKIFIPSSTFHRCLKK